MFDKKTCCVIAIGMSLQSITVTAIIQLNVDTTWDLYTQAEHITQWNFASDDWCCPTATNDLKVGGEFNYRMESRDGAVGFDFTGFYTGVIDKSKIRYKMGELSDYSNPDLRQCEVSFVAIAENETQVTVAFTPEVENPIELQKTGWQAILNNFQKYCSSYVS
jgi:uncharacterized protein YndB with AHSA1/START domain